MNFFDTVLGRKVAVKFSKEQVDDRLIGLLIHSATQSPSAGNLQEWHFVVVKDEKIKEKLSKYSSDEKTIIDAPVGIVVCADTQAAKAKYGDNGEKYAIQDTSFASMVIILGARTMSLGSKFVRVFDAERVNALLDLPEYMTPMAIIPIGYVLEEQEISRLPYENLTSLNKYGRKHEVQVVPIVNYIMEIMESQRKDEKPQKKKVILDFEAFLKKLAR